MTIEWTELARVSLAAALVAVAGMCTACAAQEKSHKELLGKPDLVAEDAGRDLKQTVVTPTLDAAIEPGRSLLWCSTFKLAWNELGTLMGPPLAVKGSGAAVELGALLNRSPQSKQDLDEGSYVADAGGPEVLARIRAALESKFKGAASPELLPASLEEGELLAYAYLFKNLSFATPFIRRERPLDFGGKGVGAFGLWSGGKNDSRDAMLKQVRILRYESDEVFTVELATTSEGDRLVIAKVVPGRTLGATIQNAMGTLNPTEEIPFRYGDSLVVPVMNFDVTRDVKELVGASVSGSKSGGGVTSAKQNIRFRLDEKGAMLKSEAAIGITLARPEPDKQMVCDDAFLVLMMRKDAAHPYFAAWIDSPELLSPFRAK